MRPEGFSGVFFRFCFFPFVFLEETDFLGDTELTGMIVLSGVTDLIVVPDLEVVTNLLAGDEFSGVQETGLAGGRESKTVLGFVIAEEIRPVVCDLTLMNSAVLTLASGVGSPSLIPLTILSCLTLVSREETV